jgi:hypothetical protein
VLAHQGGWDEIALVAGPLLLIAWLLVTLKQRAERQRAERDAGSVGPGSAGPDALDVPTD